LKSLLHIRLYPQSLPYNGLEINALSGLFFDLRGTKRFDSTGIRVRKPFCLHGGIKYSRVTAGMVVL
jgi:hypothetical protein